MGSGKEQTNAEAARLRMIQREQDRMSLQDFLRQERKSGLLEISKDSGYMEIAQNAWQEVLAVFQNQLQETQIDPIFVYDPQKQAGAYRAADGMCVQCGSNNGREAYRIGIGTTAIESGPDYLRFVLVHELAHALAFTPYGHEAEWHALLDQMIAQFNARTGRELKNDYSSWSESVPRGVIGPERNPVHE